MPAAETGSRHPAAWGSLIVVGLAPFVLAGCREAAGAGAVARTLAGRYGERAFELEVRAGPGDRTTVQVTLRGVTGADPVATAAEVARIVRREYPLTGIRDSIVVRLSTGGGRNATRTRSWSIHRFGAAEPAGP